MSQTMRDVIESSKKICHQAQKEIKVLELKRIEEAKAFHVPPIVPAFIAQHQKVLTPAEKAKITKEKKIAQKEHLEALAREKKAMDDWTETMRAKRLKLEAALNDSSAGSIH